MVKTIGKYELHRTLGEGSFGKVKYAVNKETNEAVAIKVLDKDMLRKKNMSVQIKREISLMRMINHKHVISIKDVFATATKIFMVLELVEGGELFDKIVEQGKFTDGQARFYMRQLIDGMECCHNQGICHRDLKPENLLLDAQGNLKISDFGMARLYIGDPDAAGEARAELLHTTCGTPNYVAPEVLTCQGYDGQKADVWSMGVILYVLLAGYLPFEESTTAALFKKIKSAEFEYPKWFSESVRVLLDQIMVVDPDHRISLKEFKESAWICKDDVAPPLMPLKLSSGNGFVPNNAGGDGGGDSDDEGGGSGGKTPKSTISSGPNTPATPAVSTLSAASPVPTPNPAAAATAPAAAPAATSAPSPAATATKGGSTEALVPTVTREVPVLDVPNGNGNGLHSNNGSAEALVPTVIKMTPDTQLGDTFGSLSSSNGNGVSGKASPPPPATASSAPATTAALGSSTLTLNVPPLALESLPMTPSQAALLASEGSTPQVPPSQPVAPVSRPSIGATIPSSRSVGRIPSYDVTKTPTARSVSPVVSSTPTADPTQSGSFSPKAKDHKEASFEEGGGDCDQPPLPNSNISINSSRTGRSLSPVPSASGNNNILKDDNNSNGKSKASPVVATPPTASSDNSNSAASTPVVKASKSTSSNSSATTAESNASSYSHVDVEEFGGGMPTEQSPVAGLFQCLCNPFAAFNVKAPKFE